MNIPINCPICGDILLNEYDKSVAAITGDRKSLMHLVKSCSKRLNHSYFITLNSNEELFILQLSTRFGTFYWNFENKKAWAVSTIQPSKGKQTVTDLPWFDPDIADSKKFLNKLKTYIIFV